MLKRKWARASIILAGSGLALLLVNLLLGEVVFFASESSIGWMASCGAALMLLGGFCHLFTSSCPHCGGPGPRPRWSYWDDEYCSHCGKVYPYDDRPGGPPKENPEAKVPLFLDGKPARRAMFLLAAGGLCLAAAAMIPTRFPHLRIWGPDEGLRYAKLLLALAGAVLLTAAWRLCARVQQRRRPALAEAGHCPLLPELRRGIVLCGGPPDDGRTASAKGKSGEDISPAAPNGYPPGPPASGGSLVPLVCKAGGYLRSDGR